MKSIYIISIYVVLISSCNSSYENNQNSGATKKIVPKIEKKEIKLNSSKSSETQIEDIKGVYKCFMPYESGYEEEVEGSIYGILVPSTPNTYYEIRFSSGKKVICSHRIMNIDNTQQVSSEQISGKYEIKSNKDGIKELLLLYRPLNGEGQDKIKITLNEKNNSLVYQGYSQGSNGTPHKNITMSKVL